MYGESQVDSDANLPDPAKALGLQEGDAHVIRNAGGRTVEAIRSLAISQQLLGTREIVIVHHVRPILSSFPSPNYPLSSQSHSSPYQRDH